MSNITQSFCYHEYLLMFLPLIEQYHYMDKSIGTPSCLTTLVISMSKNLNVKAYNDILGNCVLLIL